MGSPLRAAREARGLTLEQAAELSGVHMSTLSRIERTGKTKRDTAARLAAVFNLQEEQVFYPERSLKQAA